MYLLKSSLFCCMQVLGNNHIVSANCHMDSGQFYLKWDKRDQALYHFEQAYMVYEIYFKKKGSQKNSVLKADAAMQVANILEEQNRLLDAYQYVSYAVDAYTQQYGESSDNTVIASWLKLQISYTQSNQMDDFVIEIANQLQTALMMRDQSFR